MTVVTPIRGRLAELLAGEAVLANDPAEQAELERLLGQDAPGDREQMLRVAGVTQLAFLHTDAAAHQPMPDAVRQRLSRQAAAWQAGRQSAPAVVDLETARRRQRPTAAPSSPHAPRQLPAATGWLVAAALAAALLVTSLLPERASAPLAAQRAALLQEAADAITVPWSPSAEPQFARAGGDVVWSTSRQQGYLRLTGLPANEPGRNQYQLWIVDASRDVHPIDGGVFDVNAAGELIVPVRARLPVDRPAAFAVTLEKPGGVVVSDGPMLLVAAVGG